jgi:hypothetical protein
LALAVIAGVALFAGQAFASETPPVNTELPSVSPNSPYAGQVLTAKPGTWSGGVTGKKYQWSRCYAGCETITGATNVQYYTTGADVGKTMKVAVTASNEAGSTKAESKESYSVQARLGWYTCNNVVGSPALPQYSDANCSTSGSPNSYAWWRASQPIAVSGSGTGGYIIRHSYSGVSLREECVGSTGSGSLTNSENYVSVGAYAVSLSNCAVAQPAATGCKVSGGAISLAALKGSTSAYSLKGEMTLSPETGGSPVAEFYLENCQAPYGFLNAHAYTFNGTVPLSIGSGTNPNFDVPWQSMGKNLSADGQGASLEGRTTMSGVSSPVQLTTGQ